MADTGKPKKRRARRENGKARVRLSPSAAETENRKALFVRFYLIHGNAKDAAISAGYSPRSAGVAGSKLLKDPTVIKLMAEAKERKAVSLEITAERILAEMAKIAFSNIGDFYDLTQGVPVMNTANASPEAIAALSEIAVGKTGIKLKMHSKVDALKQLGAQFGLFKEAITHEAGDGFAEILAGIIASKPALPIGAGSQFDSTQPKDAADV